MNARRVTAAAGVILAAMKRGYSLPATFAIDLEAAGLLQSPESTAELEAYRALELGATDGRVSAACEDPDHPTWLRKPDDTRECPWCRVAELEAERHTTNEALSDAAEALRAGRDRIAERDTEFATWLETKAREYRSTGRPQHRLQAEALERLADKIRRGAVRPPAPPIPQPQQDSREDTYQSPLHHDYAVPHDLPEFPVQRDRRHV